MRKFKLKRNQINDIRALYTICYKDKWWHRWRALDCTQNYDTAVELLRDYIIKANRGARCEK